MPHPLRLYPPLPPFIRPNLRQQEAQHRFKLLCSFTFSTSQVRNFPAPCRCVYTPFVLNRGQLATTRAQCCLRRGAVLSLKRNLSGGDDSLVQVLCPTAKGIGSEVRGSNPDSVTKGCVILGKSSTFSEPVSYSIK